MKAQEFAAGYSFGLDTFQVQAIEAIDQGHSVLVAAPTGSGKTVVAEYAVAKALDERAKAFYTTPLKALSNQKYGDLVRRHGSENVGLLTGDNSINPSAPVVVMTTEVLRNMIYAASSALHGLRYVVLDEVHYLQNQYRGPVWEEVIIHSPREVALVCLSATVSNAEEFADWVRTVRGETVPIIEERRPVELRHLYMASDRDNDELHMLPTFVNGAPNPAAARLDSRSTRGPQRPGRLRSSLATPRRAEVIDRLGEESMLPAIFFIFSRAACDDAVRQCLAWGLRLTTDEERAEITEIAEAKVASLSDDDLRVLEYGRWIEALGSGLAAHHAGMVPPFKEAVEACFSAGLVKAVFATETLALGINMPARSVVIEKLSKFTGERHEFLTPGEYTQLTGRAGRRGIDDVGHAVVLWSPFVPFDQVAGLASTRTYALTSSFRPTYNMAANLVRRYPPAQARHLLNLSFAQYRADRDVVRLEAQLSKSADSLKAARAEATCELGDVAEYSTLSRRAEESDGGRGGADRGRADRGSSDRGGSGRGGRHRHDKGERADLRRESSGTSAAVAVKRHPVAKCPDLRSHMRAQERAYRLERDIARLERRIRGRTESLARQFDRVLRLLELRGYVADWTLTESGELLARLYHECDLLLAEALTAGLFDGLDPAGLAALASVFTFETRRAPKPGTPLPKPWFPSTLVRDRWAQLERMSAGLVGMEEDAGLPLTRALDPGFMGAAHGWATGGDLSDVMADEEMTAGDFVRNIKQLIDLVRQLSLAAPSPDTTAAAGQAADRLFRGVVAASSAIG